MPLEAYIKKRFNKSSQVIIAHAQKICAEYAELGFTLTLRQLYYQFVARGLLPNQQSHYKRLGSVISDARLAGLIDWDAIEDRTRFLRGTNHWDSPEDRIADVARSFRIDKWEDQPIRVEVWIEKDALVGVIEKICSKLDVDYFACRGYTSQSEQWRAGKRFQHYRRVGGQGVVVLHLGDHDPSGIDMTRDNQDRLNLFTTYGVDVKRIALNMDQIEEKDPPPNPVKLKDSRAENYIARFGEESWELDALDPTYLEELIKKHITSYRDPDAWNKSVARENEMRDQLDDVSDNWDGIKEFLKDE